MAACCLVFAILLTVFVPGSSENVFSRHCNGKELAVDHFRQYLRIPTVHPFPHYQPALDFIISLARSIGFDSSQIVEFVDHKGIALLTWHGSVPSLPSILLNSHMDVVPVEIEKWKHHPFEAVMEDNGDIYARGAQDTKCIGIQYLEAIRNLKHQGFVPLRTIHISFVPDEEIGGGDGFQKFVNSTLFASLNVGVALDEGLISPTEAYRVSNAEKTPWWLEIKAVGQPGHGSRLYDNSAMENVINSMENIMKYRDSQFDLVKAGLKEEAEVTSVNPVYLKAGIPTETGFTMNVQPSEAEAGFDLRIHPGADIAFLERLISEQWAPKSRGMSFKFTLKSDVTGQTEVGPSNPWWTLLVNAVEKSGRRINKAETRYSTTDGRFMRRAGIVTLGFSPISDTPIRQHSSNEFLNVAEFCKGISVYEEIIKSYASYDDKNLDNR